MANPITRLISETFEGTIYERRTSREVSLAEIRFAAVLSSSNNFYESLDQYCVSTRAAWNRNVADARELLALFYHSKAI